MIHKTVLAFVLSLSLALVPALAQAQDGGDGAGGEAGGGVFAPVQKRAIVVATVIVMATVFDQTVRNMTLLNFANLLQRQQSRLIQGGPDSLSAINELFAANQVVFIAATVLMMAMLRGARWQRAAFVLPQAVRANTVSLAMMLFAIVAVMSLPVAMMTRYGRHGLASIR
jgi:hypothetical protein